MLSLTGCLIDARKMLLFLFEQVFQLMMKIRSMHNEDTHVQEERERKPKGRENFLCLKFFLSCYTRSISFHSYQYQRSIYVLRTLDTIEVKKKKKKGMITIGQRDQRQLQGVRE